VFSLLISRYLTNPFYILLILVIAGIGGYLFVSQAQLEPKITSDFFFAKDSPIFRNNQKIGKKFIVTEAILVSVPYKDIRDPDYLAQIKKITDRLVKINGIKSVQSLSKGPANIEAGIKNPLWARLLDTKSEKNSSILCFIDEAKVSHIVRELEQVQKQFSSRRFPIYLSGIPYIIEKMRIMLAKDMKTFLAGAVAVSCVVLLLMFWSIFVTLGAVITALFASAMTLLLQQYAGVSVGVLTANLGAIVYVLTTSHIVFLTANWRNDKNLRLNRRIASAVTTTLPASFWAMLTTLCGFISLIFVEAEPLRQLGIGGSLGTLVAFVAAYLIYPIFLRFSRTGRPKAATKDKWFLPLPLWFGLPVAIAILCVSGYYGYSEYKNINKDPSLLTYFKKSSMVYKGIDHVDRQGGSNPLNFVVSSADKGNKLSNTQSFKNLQALQQELEAHPTVGSVLSLAVLMEETQQHWLARWLPWGSLLNILSKEQYDKVARGFITPDFTQALFIIRMKETASVKDRSQVINQLMAKPGKHSLRLDLVGGTYYLQTQLSKKVEASMKTGVSYLLILFGIIILLVSISPIITLFAGVSIVALVASCLALIGYFRIPFDIISSPAINICLGIAVDGMLHLIMDVKRQTGGRLRRISQKAWRQALYRQTGPIFVSSLTVALGFSVFALSQFPPSQRFGLEIVFGSLIAMVLTLLVLPQIGFIFAKREGASHHQLMPMPDAVETGALHKKIKED
jgi:uncharacterized protein